MCSWPRLQLIRIRCGYFGKIIPIEILNLEIRSFESWNIVKFETLKFPIYIYACSIRVKFKFYIYIYIFEFKLDRFNQGDLIYYFGGVNFEF